MKNLVRVLAVLMFFSMSFGGLQAQAQTDQGTAVIKVPVKRQVKLDEATGDLVEVGQAQEASPMVTNSGGNPIVIMNNQKASQASIQGSSQNAIQDQPTNVIEDSPLNMSAAERRRRERQSLELQTEQKIVEKLEEARMEDERARGDRLFNNGFGSKNHEAPQQVQVIQAPPPVAAPVSAPVAPVKEEPKVDVKQEVRAALEEMKPKSEEPKTQYYVQGLVGIGNYPDAINMRGDMATGFGVGVITPERIVAEGTFQFSQYDIETMYPNYSYAQPPFKKMTQYNFQAALKYQILSGRIRPVVGAIAGYTYRSYEDQQYYNVGVNNDVSTNAFDIGALLGLDVQLTNSFSLGVETRFMKNVAYRENSNYQRSFVYPRAGTPVEQINYYLSSLTGRFTF